MMASECKKNVKASDGPQSHASTARASVSGKEASDHGQLRVFLGMCPGVGKTCAMLQTAGREQLDGVDVAVGMIETHGQNAVAALLEGLSVIPLRKIHSQGVTLEEMDLDAVLDRRPMLVLVDELAHTNAPGSRHPRRYQDVLELLDAGISVYTTLDIGHIESRVDVVRQITGATVNETVPDCVLDRADELQLIDVPPQELRRRLDERKVCVDGMGAAAKKLFEVEHLAALREMALRFVAERAGRDVRGTMLERKIAVPWKAEERMIVAVGPDSHADQLIRWTRRIAGKMDCSWIAVHVQTDVPLEPSIKEIVTRNLSLARQLGGDVIVTSENDVSEALLRVASEHNATQIVVGRPTRLFWYRWLTGQSPAYALIRKSSSVDVSVIQPEEERRKKLVARRHVGALPLINEYIIAGIAVAAATGICLFVQPFTGYLPVALVYLLLVVVVGLKFRRGSVLAVAATSAFLWNFLFTTPRFTFYIHDLQDIMMFATLLVVALAMAHLTSRLQLTEMAERRRERSTTALYELAHQAAFATDLDTGLRAALSMTESIFGGNSALLLRMKDHTLSNIPHPMSSLTLSEKEKSVAERAFTRGMPTGKFTDTLPESEAMHLPLQGRTAVMGVLSLRPPPGRSFDLDQRDLLQAFAVLIGLILEKEHIVDAIKYAEVLNASERLRRALLDSVSHELKTPLSAIQTGIDTLCKQVSGDQRQDSLHEIRLAVQRLHRVVNNLLDMTRIEAGVVQAKREWCDVGELMQTAIASTGPAIENHQLAVSVDETLPMVKLDYALIEQALCNLVVNASAWSKPGSTISVHAALENGCLMLSVLDEGPGLSKADIDHIFEKFYRASDARPGGTGLGLSIVEGFVRAHGGNVRASNRESGGAQFTLTIPVNSIPPEHTEDFA